MAVLYASAPQAETPKRTIQYTIDSGLSQSTVSSIYQAKDGRIWFATGDGVSIFDGEDYEYIYRSTDNATGLQSNYTSVIRGGPNAHIWVGTLGGGISVFTPDGRFVFGFQADDATPAMNDIYDIAWDADGQTLVATLGGLSVIAESTGVGIDDLPDPIYPEYARQVLSLPDGRILIGTGRQGLAILGDDVVTFSRQNSDLAGDRVLDLFEDTDGRVWIATEDGGVHLFDPRTDAITQPVVLPDTDVEAVSQSVDGRLWFGTWSHGVFSYDPSTGNLENYRRGSRHDKGLSSNTVVALTAGATGMMWIGTYDGGANSVSQLPDPFETYFSDPNGIKGPISDVIWSMAEGQNDDLWVGSKGGLSHLTRASRQFEVIDLGDGGQDVRAILPYGDDLLLAIRGRGLTRYDVSADQLETVVNPQGEPVVGDAFIRLLHEDREGRIWVGTHSGVFVLDQSLALVRTYSVDDGLPHSRVRSLYRAPDGVMWIGTSGGLSRVDQETGALQSFTGPDYFPDNDVRAVWQDMDGTRYVGTQAGITVFDTNMQPQHQLLREDGLPNETIYALLPDRNRGLWAPTNNGLARLDLDNLTFDVFRSRDGLQGAEFNFNAHATLSDGTLGVGGINGISLFDPAALSTNDIPPIVTVTQDTSLDQLSAPARVALHATVAHFLDPHANELQWKLAPSDQGWMSAHGPMHSLSWETLPAGDYTLSVRGISAAGVISPVQQMQFMVSAHPSARWYAIVAYVVMAAALIWGLITYRTKRIARRAHELERQVADKTAELSKAHKALEISFSNRTQFYARAAHEIRTPISLIQAPLQSIATNTNLTADSRALLDLVQRAVKRLLRLSEDMLEGAELGATHFQGVETVDFETFVRPIIALYRDAAKDQGIPFSAQISVSGDVSLSFDALELILHNLLSNAVKYTAQPGQITVSFQLTDGNLVILVQNTGALPQSAVALLNGDAGQIDAIARRGLEIVGSAVQAVSGDIRVENDPVAITVMIPAQQDAPIAQAPEDRPTQPDLGRVLVIEDDADLRQYLVGSLGAFSVVEAVATCEAATAAIAREAPDLVLCDIVLPDGNGLTLMQTLKDDPATAHISVMFLTGQKGDVALRKAREAGADDYIIKPFDLEDILLRIQTQLRNRQALQTALSRRIESDGAATIPPTMSSDTLVSMIDAHIAENIGNDDYTIEALAAHCAISKRGLQRKLEATYGLSFRALLNQRRMALAVQLLESGVSVKEVAFACGYRHVSSFTRKFTQETGLRPAAYKGQFTDRDLKQ